MSAATIDIIESRWSGEIEVSIERAAGDRPDVVTLCLGDGAQCTIGEFTVEAADKVMRAIGNALTALGYPRLPAVPPGTSSALARGLPTATLGHAQPVGFGQHCDIPTCAVCPQDRRLTPPATIEGP